MYKITKYVYIIYIVAVIGFVVLIVSYYIIVW